MKVGKFQIASETSPWKFMLQVPSNQARHPQEAVNLAMVDIPNRQEIGPRTETLHKTTITKFEVVCKWNLPRAGSVLSGLIPGKNKKSYKAYNSKSLSGRRWEICHLSTRSKPLHYTSIFLEITYKNVANPLYQFGKNQIRALRKVISKLRLPHKALPHTASSSLSNQA